MSKIAKSVKGLAEVVLRVKDLDTMQAFYEETIGFELDIRYGDELVFLNIASGHEGFDQTMALFTEEIPPHASTTYDGLSSQKTTLHHFALAISFTDYEAVRQRVEQLGLEVKTVVEEDGRHSLYVPDPEGNVMEFVCYDPQRQ